MRIDVDLVERARCGDVEAFSEIYDSIKDELYKYALYTLGNSCDAEDAVSETFFEAFLRQRSEILIRHQPVPLAVQNPSKTLYYHNLL